MPGLLIWGDRDAYVRREQQDQLLAAFEGARLIVYDSTGHAVHWEQPQRFADDLVSFVYQRR